MTGNAWEDLRVLQSEEVPSTPNDEKMPIIQVFERREFLGNSLKGRRTLTPETCFLKEPEGNAERNDRPGESSMNRALAEGM